MKMKICGEKQSEHLEATASTMVDPSGVVRDLIAGVTLALTSIPQAVAYAELSGVAGWRGLATMGFPCMAYALVTGSPWASIGVTSITALIHLDRGEVKKIQWDVSCNLCHSGKELLCLDDNTTETCYDREGDCNDCYLLIGQGCGEGGIRCAPKVHLAWIGTDANGHNLLSSGSILSSFSDYALSPVIDSSYEGIKGSLDGDE